MGVQTQTCVYGFDCCNLVLVSWCGAMHAWKQSSGGFSVV